MNKKYCYRTNHLLYINDNKIHGWHDIHDQIQAFHDCQWYCTRPSSFQSWRDVFQWDTGGSDVWTCQWKTQCPRSSGCRDWGVDAPFPPSCQSETKKKRQQFFFQPITTKTPFFPLTDNRWSMRRWQWWQWLPRGACKRNTTWFQWRSSPSICGKPVRLHLSNPFNSRTTFFRLSMVWKHSTQNIIFTWTSKGNTRPNGLFLGSTNPRQFILTRSKSGNWQLPLTSPY